MSDNTYKILQKNTVCNIYWKGKEDEDYEREKDKTSIKL